MSLVRFAGLSGEISKCEFQFNARIRESGYIRLSFNFAEGKIINILRLVGVAVDLQRTSIPIRILNNFACPCHRFIAPGVLHALQQFLLRVSPLLGLMATASDRALALPEVLGRILELVVEQPSDFEKTEFFDSPRKHNLLRKSTVAVSSRL